MVVESWSIITIGFMRASGSLILNMEKAMRNSQMGRSTRGSMLMGSQKVLEHTFGPTASFIKVNG